MWKCSRKRSEVAKPNLKDKWKDLKDVFKYHLPPHWDNNLSAGSPINLSLEINTPGKYPVLLSKLSCDSQSNTTRFEGNLKRMWTNLAGPPFFHDTARVQCNFRPSKGEVFLFALTKRLKRPTIPAYCCFFFCWSSDQMQPGSLSWRQGRKRKRESLVSRFDLNKEIAAILKDGNNPQCCELNFQVSTFFCFVQSIWPLVRWVKTIYWLDDVSFVPPIWPPWDQMQMTDPYSGKKKLHHSPFKGVVLPASR